MTHADRLAGLLLGTALGDAVGLPREGLSRRRAERRFGLEPWPALVFGRGLVSDDTEHACLTAQALLASAGEPARFARDLAWRLRGWLLGLPAGAGRATLRACLRLWAGAPPARSGVPSAGNGPAMRAPVLGACVTDEARLRELVRASTRLTHTDPRAEQGALTVALAARWATEGRTLDPPALLAWLRERLDDAELDTALAAAGEHLASGTSPAAFASALGCGDGVSGYIHHTVPAALYCWLCRPDDPRAAIREAVCLGGDTDSVAAITGALAGAAHGAAALPADWLAALCEWPRSVRWLTALGGRLSEGFPATGEPRVVVRPLPLCWPGLLPRNLAFLVIVLVHGFRRLLPPY